LTIIFGLPFLISRFARKANAITAESVEFVRALYDFNGDGQVELRVQQGDLIAVLDKTGDWWRGRMRDGRVGIFPANYVEPIKKA